MGGTDKKLTDYYILHRYKKSQRMPKCRGRFNKFLNIHGEQLYRNVIFDVIKKANDEIVNGANPFIKPVGILSIDNDPYKLEDHNIKLLKMQPKPFLGIVSSE